MDNIALIIGLVISPIVTVVGLVLNHQANLRTTAALAEKTKVDGVKVVSEAEKIEAETAELGIKNQSAQMQYWITITENLRSDVAELRKEKNELANENILLRQQITNQNMKIDAQDYEMARMQSKIEVLEGRKAA